MVHYFRSILRFISAVFLLTFTIVTTRPVQAGTAIQVSPVPNGAEFAPDEYGENTQYCSLREAIQAANTDKAVGGCPAGSGTDTIYVPAGKYRLTRAAGSADDNSKGDLDILSSLTIFGAGSDQTILVSSVNDRVFDIFSSSSRINVSIASLTITGGSTEVSKDSGSGIRNNNSNLSVQNVVLDGNKGNITTSSGGGIANLSSGELLIINSTIRNNSSGFGGGIYNIGKMEINNSLISDNKAERAGGGIDIISDQQSIILDVTIAKNSVQQSGNTSGGGGLAVSGPVTITNSTIVDNTGEAIRINDNTATVRNSIIARSSSGPNCQIAGDNGAFQSDGYNIQDFLGPGSNLCSFNGVGDQTVASASDLMLDTVYSDHGGYTYTYAILSDASPAVDAIPEGNPYCPSFDQRWLIRTARCDIGAYEYGGLTPDQKVYLPAVRR